MISIHLAVQFHHNSFFVHALLIHFQIIIDGKSRSMYIYFIMSIVCYTSQLNQFVILMIGIVFNILVRTVIKNLNFKQFLVHVLQIYANPEKFDGYEAEPPEPKPLKEGEEPPEYNGKTKGHWDKRLTSFQKLMFIKVFKEEKVCHSLKDTLVYVHQHIHQYK